MTERIKGGYVCQNKNCNSYRRKYSPCSNCGKEYRSPDVLEQAKKPSRLEIIKKLYPNTEGQIDHILMERVLNLMTEEEFAEIYVALKRTKI